MIFWSKNLKLNLFVLLNKLVPACISKRIYISNEHFHKFSCFFIPDSYIVLFPTFFIVLLFAGAEYGIMMGCIIYDNFIKIFGVCFNFYKAAKSNSNVQNIRKYNIILINSFFFLQKETY